MPYSRLRLSTQLKLFRVIINVIDFPELFTSNSGTQVFVGYVRIFFTYTDDQLRDLVLLCYVVYRIGYQSNIWALTAARASLVELDREMCWDLVLDAIANDPTRWAIIYARAQLIVANTTSP